MCAMRWGALPRGTRLLKGSDMLSCACRPGMHPGHWAIPDHLWQLCESASYLPKLGCIRVLCLQALILVLVVLLCFGLSHLSLMCRA